MVGGLFVQRRGAQPFRYCRPHIDLFYELRPLVSSIYFFCIACVLLPHTEASLLSHVNVAVFLLSILLQ